MAHESHAAYYVPIQDMSAFSSGQRSLAITLKVYCDGSGKTKEAACRFLTLAGMIASDDYWRDFEAKWKIVLDKHSVPYSHMRKLLRGKEPFHGWLDSDKQSFVSDLLNVLGTLDHRDLVASTLTINLDDYRQLAIGTSRIRPAEAVCGDYVMTHAFRHPRFSEGNAEIFFDRDESFIKYVERIWSRNKDNASSWASYVSTVAPADMKKILPIQAADVLAWSANRENASNKEDFWNAVCPIATILMLPNIKTLYGKTELMKHPGFYSHKETGSL
jgi:Protein of unknown function (DUF3800)